MSAIDFNRNEFESALPPSATDELMRRFNELSKLEKDEVEMGTTVPQLYGSLSKFVANPSTVSVETYKRMLDTDDTLGSGIDFLLLAMLARWGEYRHKSKEIQDFVTRAIGEMEGSWHENLEEMLSSEWAGFSVTEKVWRHVDDFHGLPAYVPKRLATYPPLTIVFAVDRQGNILPEGIYQYQRYYNAFFSSYAAGLHIVDQDGFRPDLFASQGDFPYPIRIASDLSYLTVRIPRNKVIHMRSSTTGKFNNPYGRSLLRRAYKNWVLKDAFLKLWVIGADRKSTPLLVGYAAPNNTVLQQDNSERGAGAITEERSDLALARALKNVHQGSAIILPGKREEDYFVDAVQLQGDLNVMKDGVNYFNTAMLRSLLIPSLVFGNGDGSGSYSLGQEHHKIFSKVIDGKLKPHKQAVLDQFVKDIIQKNFPERAWKRDGFGEFALEEHDTELMEKLSNVYSNLTDRGYMSPEDQTDMDEVRTRMNLRKKQAVQAMNPIVDPSAGGQGMGPEFGL